MTFGQILRERNLARAALWHPGGVECWTPSQWFTAMAGEIGELVMAGLTNTDPCAQPVRDEAADVLIYADLLLARLGLPPVEDERWTDSRPIPDLQRGLPMAQLLLAGDCIKKLSRAHEGLTGNSVDVDALLIRADGLIRQAFSGLQGMAPFCVQEAIIHKFNEVSRRNGFDVFMPDPRAAGAQGEEPPAASARTDALHSAEDR